MTHTNGAALVSAQELKEQLHDGRLDIDAVDDDGRTPLHRAIDLGAEDLAAFLVSAGADVNRRDRWGNTPLWRAVYHAPGTEAIVDLLLERGADPAVKNNHDVSPIDLAHKMTDDDDTAKLLPTLEAALSTDE
jgi:ankyrin repeat protein